MLIAADVKRTSSASPWSADLSSLYGSGSRHAGPSEILSFFGSCKPVAENLLKRSGPFASGKRDAYSAQVMINSPSVTSFIRAGFGNINYTVYGLGTHAPVQYMSRPLRLARLPEEISAFVFESWETPGSEFTAALSASVDDLRNIVSAIRARARLQRSSAVEALIQQAVRGRGMPEDVQAWAQRLAQDVGKLAD